MMTACTRCGADDPQDVFSIDGGQPLCSRCWLSVARKHRKPPNGAKTAVRLLRMLNMIPKWPNKTTIDTLRDRLADIGCDVTNRTVERNLKDASAYFPLMSDGHKPMGWCWAKDSTWRGVLPND